MSSNVIYYNRFQYLLNEVLILVEQQNILSIDFSKLNKKYCSYPIYLMSSSGFVN